MFIDVGTSSASLCIQKVNENLFHHPNNRTKKSLKKAKLYLWLRVYYLKVIRLICWRIFGFVSITISNLMQPLTGHTHIDELMKVEDH